MQTCGTRLPPVPTATARAALAVLGKGNPYVMIGDQLDEGSGNACWTDALGVAAGSGDKAYVLALVTVFQYVERLPDRRAAEAVRKRVDWKYALRLTVDHPGLDRSELVQFRRRLFTDWGHRQALDRLLTRLGELGFLDAAGRSASVTEVLATVERLGEMERATETIRAALEALAASEPDWLLEVSLPHWYERYGRPGPVEHEFPDSLVALNALMDAIEHDILYLLGQLDRAGRGVADLTPEVQALRRVGIELIQGTTGGRPPEEDVGE